MRRFCLVLLAALSWTTLAGCQKSTAPTGPLSPDQERKMQEQLQKARHAEGAAQKAPATKS